MENIKRVINDYNNKGPKFRLSKLKEEILKYQDELPSVSDDVFEDLYLIKMGLKNIPTCSICGSARRFKTYKKGYYKTCNRAKCRNKYTAHSIKSSFKEKYGVENPSELKSVQEKREKTCLSKYGVKNPYQADSIKDKIKSTWLSKYGVDNPNKVKAIRDKIKATLLDRYGVDNAYQIQHVLDTLYEKYGDNFGFGSDYFKEKSKESNMEKYGRAEFLADNDIHKTISKTMNLIYGGRGWGSDEIRNKIEATNLERFGNKIPSKTEEVQNTRKNTCLRKYGCEHQMQNLEIFEKNSKKAFKWKKIKLPSGRIESVQGYEPRAIDQLLEEGYHEDDLFISNKDIESETGKIYYYDGDIKRRYYPDIYIKSENHIIEVKSKYIYEKHKAVNELKREACENMGLKFTFIIINK